MNPFVDAMKEMLDAASYAGNNDRKAILHIKNAESYIRIIKKDIKKRENAKKRREIKANESLNR